MPASRSALTADNAFGFLSRETPSSQTFHPQLIRNDEPDTMLRAIKDELRRSESFVFSVAFIASSALALLKQDLLDFAGRGTIITSTYLDFNDPDMFRELLVLPGIDVRVMEDGHSGFHTKGYVFRHPSETTAIVGSSNLTRTALLVNQEWNLRFSALPDGDIVDQLEVATARLMAASVPLTEEWIDDYARRWKPRLPSPMRESGLETVLPPTGDIFPNAMQQEALEALDQVRSEGESRALIISATGTGKTILAALAARQMRPQRILFVAHREQILRKAAAEFSRVLGLAPDQVGFLGGGHRDLERQHVFATIDTLRRAETLAQLSPTAFDLIIVDEVHRAGADSYRGVLQHFTPQFLLGLTATPERTDGANIFELFHFNVPYEIRLQAALQADMLAPFHYYGVADVLDEQGRSITETSALSTLTAEERIAHIIHMLEVYGHAGTVRGLMFCSRNEEAAQLSALLNSRTVHGRTLRTVALSGADAPERREAVIQQLEVGELDYILTVDIFNEGIDIPSVNQVVMVRSTQSSIVFTQQLGRGLRKAVGKDHLRVIDFIGNYRNNFMIPIALFGDSSLNKDEVRKKLIEAQASGTIAGVSSITFQEDARQRVFESLAKVKLDSIANLKQAVTELERRLGRLPRLLDFARYDTVDPVIMATKSRNYWTLLHQVRKVDVGPTGDADNLLTLLSAEVLNGKRPQELLLLRELFADPSRTMTREEISALFARERCAADDRVVASAIRVLTLEFAVLQDRTKYGDTAVLEETGGGVRLSDAATSLYSVDAVFRAHAHDIVATGLYLARHRYDWIGRLTPGQRYSRKDVCRILGWDSNQQGVMFGYKVDIATSTCPVFITYHKGSDVLESIAYGDEFRDPRTIRWFTRSRRTLEHNEVRRILAGDDAPAMEIFVKKDDAEGTDFFYLGGATPTDPQQRSMPTVDGEPLPVVTMDLALEQPVSPELYDYLTAGS